jgi:hypothetical protein
MLSPHQSSAVFLRYYEEQQTRRSARRMEVTSPYNHKCLSVSDRRSLDGLVFVALSGKPHLTSQHMQTCVISIVNSWELAQAYCDNSCVRVTVVARFANRDPNAVPNGQVAARCLHVSTVRQSAFQASNATITAFRGFVALGAVCREDTRVRQVAPVASGSAHMCTCVLVRGARAFARLKELHANLPDRCQNNYQQRHTLFVHVVKSMSVTCVQV